MSGSYNCEHNQASFSSRYSLEAVKMLTDLIIANHLLGNLRDVKNKF